MSNIRPIRPAGPSRLDRNGNPKLGYAHPAEGVDTFDKASVKAGIGQVWTDADDTHYNPVEVLDPTDTLPERLRVAVLSASGDVLPEVERAVSFFATLRLTRDPSVKMAQRRPVPNIGIEGRLIKAGTPADFVQDSNVAAMEIGANLAKIFTAASRNADNLQQAIVSFGNAPWLNFAAVLSQFVGDHTAVLKALTAVRDHAESLALRDLDMEATMLLSVIADADPRAGLTREQITGKLNGIVSHDAIAAFNSVLGEYAALGWIQGGSGAEGEQTIAPGPRLHEVVFFPSDADVN